MDQLIYTSIPDRYMTAAFLIVLWTAITLTGIWRIYRQIEHNIKLERCERARQLRIEACNLNGLFDRPNLSPYLESKIAAKQYQLITRAAQLCPNEEDQ